VSDAEAVALALAPYGAQWRAPFLSVDAFVDALNVTRAVAVGVATRHECGNVTVQSRDAEGLVTRYLLGFEPRVALPVP